MREQFSKFWQFHDLGRRLGGRHAESGRQCSLRVLQIGRSDAGNDIGGEDVWDLVAWSQQRRAQIPAVLSTVLQAGLSRNPSCFEGLDHPRSLGKPFTLLDKGECLFRCSLRTDNYQSWFCHEECLGCKYIDRCRL